MAESNHKDQSIVLLVDDNPETLGMLIAALEEAGLMAIVARDGTSALQLLGRIEPDLILLDALMPGLDGFETCRRIKALPQLATTPVVFMTGLSDSEHVLAGLRAGGVDYVLKPIKPDELIARISVHVANARMISEAREALDTAEHGVVAFRPSWTVSWTSPRGSALLADASETRDPLKDERLVAWLETAANQPISNSSELELGCADGQGVRITLIGRSAAGDILARIGLKQRLSQPDVLSGALGISTREGEVLAWLAHGKSNRDIADILTLSPRTVTKHVEQIFLKLGVENRTAAAAIALRHLFNAESN